MTLIALGSALVIGLIVAVCVVLFVPFIIGAGANAVTGRITGRELNIGCLGYILIAFVGAFIGGRLFGPIGPEIFDIHILPAFLGSLIVTLVISLIFNRQRRRY